MLCPLHTCSRMVSGTGHRYSGPERYLVSVSLPLESDGVLGLFTVPWVSTMLCPVLCIRS